MPNVVNGSVRLCWLPASIPTIFPGESQQTFGNYSTLPQFSEGRETPPQFVF